ncbi:uncharacterized protein BDW70DRAFT_71164 [Aspergillus foveolatus]|uniref:uncharacterized protein n=1 Tax=Aspergillus foveolatus TaxID=210207 RepID=UPI003CCD7A8A
MSFFCSRKTTVSKDVPYSWYWNGKSLRSGYKRGEYIREVRTNFCEAEPCGYYSDQHYTYHEHSHRYRHVYNYNASPRRFSSRSDRYSQASCYHPPRDSRWCQQKRYCEPQCYCPSSDVNDHSSFTHAYLS